MATPWHAGWSVWADAARCNAAGQMPAGANRRGQLLAQCAVLAKNGAPWAQLYAEPDADLPVPASVPAYARIWASLRVFWASLSPLVFRH